MANRVLEIILRAKDLATGVLKRAETGVTSFERTTSRAFRSIGALIGGAALVRFFKDSIKEAAKAEKGLGGPVSRLVDGWKRLKQAVGEALVGNEKLGGGLSRLGGLLEGLEGWIVKNSAAIGAFVGGLVWVTEKIGDLIGLIVEFVQKRAVDFALAWDTIAARAKRAVGSLLQTFGEFLGSSRELLFLFGDGLTKVADGMADAGARMVRESTKQLGEIKDVRAQMYAEIEAGEKGLTEAERKARREREAAARAAEERRKEHAKRLAQELERVNREIAVKTLQLEKGLTEKQAEEAVRREEVLTGAVKRTVKSVTEGYARLDRLNLLLSAGFDQDVTPAVKDTERAVAKLNTTLRAAPPAKPIKAAAQQAQVFNEELVSAVRGSIGIAQGLGAVDDRMAAAAQNAITFAENIGKAAGGSPTAIIAAVGGLAGTLSSLFGESAETRARKALLAANTRALEENTSALELQTPGGQVAGAEAALSAFLGAKGAENADIQKIIESLATTGTITPSLFRELAGKQLDTSELAPFLLAQGLGIGDLEKLGEDLGITIRNPESGKIELRALAQLLQAIQGIQPGFGTDIGSQLERISTGVRIGAIAPEAELGEILKVISSQGAESPVLNAALAKFFQTGERSDAIQALQALFTNIGNVPQGELGALNLEQTIDLIEKLIGLFTSEQGFTLPLPTGTSASLGAFTAPSTLLPGIVPTFAAPALSAPTTESVDLLGSIDTTLLEIRDYLKNGPPAPTNVQLQFAGVGGADPNIDIFRKVQLEQLVRGIVARSL